MCTIYTHILFYDQMHDHYFGSVAEVGCPHRLGKVNRVATHTELQYKPTSAELQWQADSTVLLLVTRSVYHTVGLILVASTL